jgi:hypothetical protein
MLKIATLLILLGMLAGCAASASDEWAKPGGTKEQANKDSADCLFNAEVMRGAGAGMTVDQVQYRQCMVNKGYKSNK